MTDPGDRAATDTNVRTDLPDAKPTTINPEVGEAGKDQVVRSNTHDQAEKLKDHADPLDR